MRSVRRASGLVQTPQCLGWRAVGEPVDSQAQATFRNASRHLSHSTSAKILQEGGHYHFRRVNCSKCDLFCTNN